jgi:hypothetical protein
MDDEYGRSLRTLLPDSFERMEDVVKEKLSSEPGADWGRVPKFAWNFVGSRATEAVHKVLGNGRLRDHRARLGKGGRAARVQRSGQVSARQGKQDPSVRSQADRKSASRHRSDHLGFGQTKLKFTLELTATFRSAELHIKGGRIVAVAAGDCSASAQLKYGDLKLHNEVKTADLKLGRPLPLDPALTIG